MSTTGTALKKDEITFYSDNNGVRVTNSRFIIGSTTYAMANITSIKQAVTKPSTLGPLVMCGVGALFVLTGFGSSTTGQVVFGALVLLGGVFWWKSLKPTYAILVSSSSGEASPMSSKDQRLIEGIVQAVNEAIIGRG